MTSTTAQALFLAQLASTLFLTGLIWFVQIVHYPLFAIVGEAYFPRYEVLHAQRTGWVVFPPMLIELVTASAALLPALRAQGVSRTGAIVSAALVLAIWLSTALVQIPLHNALGSHPTREIIDRLVLTNWLRTVAWTARSALLLTALAQTLHPRNPVT